MTPDLRWFVLVPILLLLLWLLHRNPELAERTEERIKGFFIFLLICIGALAAIYGLVGFVRWAWYN